jgi:plasmid maintenance system antidote protein VapI
MRPAEVFHVGEYIQDELDARGWTTRDCAEHMGQPDLVDRNTFALDMLILVPDPRIILCDEQANCLACAFGTSAEIWKNLHAAWLERVRESN